MANTTVDGQFNAFHETLSKALDKAMPLRAIKIKPKKNHQPWITKGIQRTMKRLKKYYKDTLKLNGKDVTMSSVSHYRAYHSTLQQLKRHSKLKYYHDQCTTMHGNTKKLWGLINSVIKKTSNKLDCIEYLTVDKLRIYDSQQIANEMGKYFADVGKSFAPKYQTLKRK